MLLLLRQDCFLRWITEQKQLRQDSQSPAVIVLYRIEPNALMLYFFCQSSAVAALFEVIGWQNTIFLWFVIAALGGVVCMVCARPRKKKMMD